VGVVSRSGTLTYEVVYHLTRAGLGQSTCVGIGGDPINGTGFIDALEAFENDPDTRGRGHDGRDRRHGRAGRRRVHQGADDEAGRGLHRRADGAPGPPHGARGAIISGSSGTAAEKIESFEAAGMGVAKRPIDFVELVRERLH
jgi:succinyl-CoA synthetase alpha subunit